LPSVGACGPRRSWCGSTTVGYRWFTRDEIRAREGRETFLPGLGTPLGDVLKGTVVEPVSLTG
jgi:hypothetical protein